MPVKFWGMGGGGRNDKWQRVHGRREKVQKAAPPSLFSPSFFFASSGPLAAGDRPPPLSLDAAAIEGTGIEGQSFLRLPN